MRICSYKLFPFGCLWGLAMFSVVLKTTINLPHQPIQPLAVQILVPGAARQGFDRHCYSVAVANVHEIVHSPDRSQLLFDRDIDVYK
jgi:hypothetical protein